jgi:hypothetical protein
MVLQAILDVQGDTSAFVNDIQIIQSTRLTLADVRNWLLTLEQEDYIDLTPTSAGLSTSITPKGRLTLGLYRPLPAQPAASPPTAGLTRLRSKTGRERALVVGISEYPLPIPRLPAVANDVREIAQVLSSDRGEFPAGNVRRLADGEATRQEVLAALDSSFQVLLY